MTMIHLVGGMKGGVGKSFVCRALIDYHRKRELPFTIIDTGHSYRDVARFYENVENCQVESVSSDEIAEYVEVALANGDLDRSIIVNLQPGETPDVLGMRLSQEYSEARYQDTSICLWFVSTGEHSSRLLLEQSLEKFQNSVPHILVKNSGGISYWNLDDVGEQFEVITERYRLPVIEFPKLSSGWILDEIQLRNIPLSEMQIHPDLDLTSRLRAKAFLEKAFAAFDSAGVL